MDSAQLEQLRGSVRSIEPNEFLLLRRIELEMLSYWDDIRSSNIILIGERWNHIVTSHPEILGHEEDLFKGILDPYEIHHNKQDRRIAIFYSPLQSGYWIRLPVWVSNRSDRENSLLSARYAKEAEVLAGRLAGRAVWRKS